MADFNDKRGEWAMPQGPKKTFSKPMRELFREGLREIALSGWPDLVNVEFPTSDLPSLPTEDREEFVRSLRNLVLEAGVELIVGEVGPYIDNLYESVERIQNLVLAAINMPEGTREDALRASVVLLHASLEDFLRTLSAELLPIAGEEVLNEIPLAGLDGRAKPFPLGKLVQHKGKKVDDVLRESVREYLERSNYNNTQEISVLLETLGFTVANHNAFFPQLGEMIKRRHQIVHRADKTRDANSDGYVLQPIAPSDVQTWLTAVTLFVGGLLPQVARKLCTSEKIEASMKAFGEKLKTKHYSTRPDLQKSSEGV